MCVCDMGWEGVIKTAVHSLLRWSSPPTMVVSSNFLHGEKKKPSALLHKSGVQFSLSVVTPSSLDEVASEADKCAIQLS